MSFDIAKFDGDTKYVHADGNDRSEPLPGSEIDHGASAKANLSEAGQNLVKMVTPDKVMDAVNMMRDTGGGDYGRGIGQLFGFLYLPWAVAIDAVELVVQPLLATKNAVDAAIHGVMAGVKK